jgi:hypothetical protein
MTRICSSQPKGRTAPSTGLRVRRRSAPAVTEVLVAETRPTFPLNVGEASRLNATRSAPASGIGMAA